MLNIIEKEEAAEWWLGLIPDWQVIYNKLFGDRIAAYRYFGQPDSPIPFFVEYRFLSNFHICPVEYEGLQYTSSEAAYQSAKTELVQNRTDFLKMTPGKSMKEGRARRYRDGWDDMKNQVMFDVLKSKFTLNPDLMLKLKATGNRRLEETNWWDDKWYGVYKGKGENHLGKLLMQIRDL